MKHNSLAYLKAVAIAVALVGMLMSSCSSSKSCRGLAAHPNYKTWKR
jgi:hypothetical protein